MKKKTGRIGILLVIAAVVVFVLFDFFKDSSKEEKAREAASQQEQVVPDEPEQTDKDLETDQSDEETDFDSTDELEEDFTSEDEDNEDKSPLLSYGANKGDTAYDYEMTDIETGEIVKLSDFRGQKVFLNFWASWCPPCRVEAPHLQDFSENQDDVAVLGVNVKVSESNVDNVQEFIDEFGLTFQNFFGPEEMFGPFLVESLPTSFFIDSNGVIQERVTGPVTEDVLNGVFSMID